MDLSLDHLNSIVQFPPPLMMKNVDAALAFHISVLTWMDVLACVSTRQRPKLPYDTWLSQKDKFELANVIGCHNWALKAIGDLGTLNERMLETEASGTFNFEEFRKRGQQIEDDLEDGIESLPIKAERVRSVPRSPCSGCEGPLTHTYKDIIQASNNPVTRIFATAALVQLQILTADVSCDHSPSKLRRAVSRVILEIQMFQNPPSARSIIWPICIAGCLADQDQRAFFQELITDILSGATGMIGNCDTALKIMQRCWELKTERPDERWECGCVMVEMGMCTLLI